MPEMEPTHEITVKYRVTVPHELADVMDQVETDVDEWLMETDTVKVFDEDDEEQEVSLSHVETTWKSL